MKTHDAPRRGRGTRRQGKGQGVGLPLVTHAPSGRTGQQGKTVDPKPARKRASGSFPAPGAAGSQPPETSLSFRQSEGAPLPHAAAVTGDELAGLLGIAPRSVRSLAERGVVVRAGRGRYDLSASIPRYCESLREAAAGRGGEATVVSLSYERARLASEQADLVALKNAVARRELVPAVEVEREWTSIVRALRAAMLALPSRVQQRLGHLTAQDAAAIDQEVRDILTEIAKPEASNGPQP